MSWKDAQGSGEFCHEFYIVPDIPPVATCPGTQSQHTNGSFVATGLTVNDPDCPSVSNLSSVTASFTGGGITGVTLDPAFTPGGCDYAASINYTVTDHCAAGGIVTVIAFDTGGRADTCFFGINLTNTPPVPTCPPNDLVYNDKEYTATVTATDADGDDVDFALVSGPAGLAVTQEGIVTWTPTCADTVGNPHVVVVEATDACGAAAECQFELTVVCVKNPAVVIGEVPCANPGDLVYLPISITKPFITALGGFELHVDFDYTSMTFVGADAGWLINGDSVEVQKGGLFEEFTYRMLPCPSCGCCKYKILLFGMYDLPNGTGGVAIPAGAKGDLAYLKFVVNTDENLRGLKIQVCWQWTPCEHQPGHPAFDPDCGENTSPTKPETFCTPASIPVSLIRCAVTNPAPLKAIYCSSTINPWIRKLIVI